jgi:hypothetical protein
MLLLLPLREVPAWKLGGAAGPRPNLFDVVLAATAAVCVPSVLARRRVAAITTIVPLVLVALLLVALVAHPSWSGAVEVARLAAAAVVALAIGTAPDPRATLRIIAAVLLAGAAVQAVIAVGQRLYGAPLGLGFLGEASQALYPVGRSMAPRGTFQHQYPLAGFVILAAFTGVAVLISNGGSSAYLWWIAVAVVPVGMTYSRSAAAAVFLGIGSLALGMTVTAGRRRAVLAGALVAVAAGSLVPALVWPAGWQARLASTEQALARRSPDDVSTSRLYLAGSAVRLIRSSPVIGIGPGRYSEASSWARRAAPRTGDLVHNLPLYVAVVSGAPAGLVVVALLVGTGVRAFRSGAAPRTLYVAFLPFVLLDRFPFDGPQGLVLTATWLGLTELLARRVGHTKGAEPSPCVPTVAGDGRPRMLRRRGSPRRTSRRRRRSHGCSPT